jgi:MFS family permease
MQQDISERAYELLTDDSEERACKAIPDTACHVVPGNFFLNMLNGACTKFAEQLASPGLVIPWILSTLAAPAYFAGMLIPIKDAGSLLPQLLVSAKIRSFPKRKWFWIAPAFIQSLCIFGMAWVVSSLDGFMAGLCVVLALLIFSIASGVASVSFKDVLAKTIPKGKRGQLLAYRAASGGILTLMAGIYLHLFFSATTNTQAYVWLLIIAGIFWVLAAVFFISIQEVDGATEGGRTPIKELKNGKDLWINNSNFRKFIFTRGLLMAIPLAQPFYVIIGKEYAGGEVSGLGLMVIAVGLAGIISSPIWGKFADKSSRKMMVVVSVLGIVNAGYVLLFPMLPADWQNIYTFSPAILLNVIAHGGARLSRKTYLIDFAPKSERPLYVSLSNTLIGILTLVAAALGLIAEIFSLQIMVGFLAALLLLSIPISLKLKEV